MAVHASPDPASPASPASPSPEKRHGGCIVPGIKDDIVAGRYRIERLLGVGSSGFVVEARHIYLRRRVTLKILASTTKAHQTSQRRHLAVAHRAAGLRGRHIARVVDTGFTEDGTAFVATEHLEGRTLESELGERGVLPTAVAVRWILEACEGLAEAHATGIVHGDLKPQNLFLAGKPPAQTDTVHTASDGRVLKILDFGMASPVDEGTDEGTSTWFASPAYLSPEQIHDPASVDARTDVWALGVILQQTISGSLPFASDTVSGMLVSVAYDEPALLTGADVPFELARVVRSCLSKRPDARPADVAALATMLAPFAGERGLAAAARVESALSLAPPPMAMVRSIEDDVPAAEATVAVAYAPPGATAMPKTIQTRGGALVLSRSRRQDGGRAMRVDAERVRGRRRTAAFVTLGLAGALAVAGLLAPSPSSSASPAVSEATNAAHALVATTEVTSAEIAPNEPTAVATPTAPTGAPASPSVVIKGVVVPTPVAVLPAAPPVAPIVQVPSPRALPPAPPVFPSTPRPVAGTSVGDASRGATNASAASATSAAQSQDRSRARRSETTAPPSVRNASKETRSGKAHSALAVREDPYVKGFTHPTRLNERRK